MSDKEQNPPLHKQPVSRSRSAGATHEMVLEIKKTLEERGECGVGLLRDPKDILKRLSDLGIVARAEPTYRNMPAEINGDQFQSGEKVQTGYVFYCG